MSHCITENHLLEKGRYGYWTDKWFEQFLCIFGAVCQRIPRFCSYKWWRFIQLCGQFTQGWRARWTLTNGAIVPLQKVQQVMTMYQFKRWQMQWTLDIVIDLQCQLSHQYLSKISTWVWEKIRSLTKHQ